MITLDERPDEALRKELEELYLAAIEAIRVFSDHPLSCCCVRRGMNGGVFPEMKDALEHIYRMSHLEDEIEEDPDPERFEPIIIARNVEFDN